MAVSQRCIMIPIFLHINGDLNYVSNPFLFYEQKDKLRNFSLPFTYFRTFN